MSTPWAFALVIAVLVACTASPDDATSRPSAASTARRHHLVIVAHEDDDLFIVNPVVYERDPRRSHRRVRERERHVERHGTRTVSRRLAVIGERLDQLARIDEEPADHRRRFAAVHVTARPPGSGARYTMGT